jgi:sortase A
MRGLRWRIAESVFLIAGLALLDWYIWSRAGAVVYQAYENYLFRGQLREEQKSPPVVPAPTPPRSHRNDLVGRLEVPRLGIRVMVHEGDDHDILAGAAGHLPSSPVPGWPGNVAVAAHRDTFFRPLRNIRVNDKILFATLNGTFEYQVESLKIVDPDDVSVLKASAEPTLTLVTCYPFYYVGSAPQRFIVRARQVGSSPPRVEEAALLSPADPAASGRPARGSSPSPAVSASAGRRHPRS